MIVAFWEESAINKQSCPSLAILSVQESSSSLVHTYCSCPLMYYVQLKCLNEIYHIVSCLQAQTLSWLELEAPTIKHLIVGVTNSTQ